MIRRSTSKSREEAEGLSESIYDHYLFFWCFCFVFDKPFPLFLLFFLFKARPSSHERKRKGSIDSSINQDTVSLVLILLSNYNQYVIQLQTYFKIQIYKDTRSRKHSVRAMLKPLNIIRCCPFIHSITLSFIQYLCSTKNIARIANAVHWTVSRSLTDCKSLFLNVMIQDSQFVSNSQQCH